MLNLAMAGIDFNKASIDVRERFALTLSAQAAAMGRLRHLSGVSGCVIINTCNRMELWVSVSGALEQTPLEMLCGLFRVDAREHERFFTQREGEEAVEHLFELACGLKSLIFGEEQILTQVRESVSFARECKASDPILEAAFRSAVTAAKRAKTQVRLVTVDRSAARSAVGLLRERFGDLKGLPCLVIGSGEMGRLSAKALAEEGCAVTMTLRQYRSGESIIPSGCCAVDYTARYDMLAGARVVVSATRSPHFTLTREQVRERLGEREAVIFDLAVPRDIDPEIGTLPNISLYDIDGLGGNGAAEHNSAGLAQVRAIIAEEIRELERWNSVRNLIPKINALSAAAAADAEERIQLSLKDLPLDEDCLSRIHAAAAQAVSKSVESMLMGLRKETPGDVLDRFFPPEEPVDTADSPAPPRFPLFVDLSGRRVVVIGGGTIALRRVKALLAYPCDITVVAPDLSDGMSMLTGRLTLCKKEYDPADLDGAYLVIAATDDRALNHRIGLDALRRGQHCSIADRREECSFYFPATVHYDGGVIGICGTGENHGATKALAADIRAFMSTREGL